MAHDPLFVDGAAAAGCPAAAATTTAAAPHPVDHDVGQSVATLAPRPKAQSVKLEGPEPLIRLVVVVSLMKEIVFS